jgi:hypothetical protein
MTEPARIEVDADVEAAREALVPRMRKGDLRAFEEFFALSGGTVTFLDDEA